jgi:hypothetical protein
LLGLIEVLQQCDILEGHDNGSGVKEKEEVKQQTQANALSGFGGLTNIDTQVDNKA